MSNAVRGSNKIFKDFFHSTTQCESPNLKKGRNVELNNKRNECLLDRYFYYGSVTQYRYETIIDKLSVEFFLSRVTIPKVIDSNYDLLALKKKEYKGIPEEKLKKTMAEKWPHLSW